MICGIDFGTTNSSCTTFDPEQGRLTEHVLDPINTRYPHLLRSLLYFPPESHDPVCGLGALDACIQQQGEGRFIASIKAHLASRITSGTSIHGRSVSLSQLVAILLRRIRRALPPGTQITRLNAGRPVRFSTDLAEDQLAEKRLSEAYQLAGFPPPRFVLEPVAAAHALGEQVPRGVKVLVSDFGGGTLDLSAVIFEQKERLTCRVLANHGIWLGGDTIDGALVYRLFREYFGFSVEFWNWDRSKLMPLPASLFAKLSHWRHIWRLSSLAETLRETIQWGITDAEPIERLLAMLDDHSLPVELFSAVERAKVELSESPESEIRFRRDLIEILRPLGVREFEELLRPELQEFRDALAEVLRLAAVKRQEISYVICTGGTSQVPRFRREILAVLPNARILGDDFFGSVSRGLALIE